ncbi:MAG: serine/threonine-protein kinase [Myxococcota bacterium]
MAPPDERLDGQPPGSAGGGGDAAPADPLIGALVAGKYRVRSWVARGGMGRIYRAEQEPLGRPVALKVLTPPAADRDATLEKRFLLEAATYAKLSHPNTVTVHDYGPLRVGPEDTFFIVLEWVNGRTLSQAIKQDPPFSAARTLRIAREICRSLREAHALGIVHRDLKPGNVMLVQRDEGESVKVLDFGVAKIVQEGHEGVTTHASFLGSPRYSSPEQIKQDEVDHRADIYALGIVMYEMLAGQTPFGGGETMRTMYAHLNTPVPTIKEKSGRDAPPEVEDLVRRCLEKDPANRWPDVDMLLEEIREVATGLGVADDVAPDTWSGSGTRRGVPMDPPAPDPEPSIVRPAGVGVIAGVIGAAVLAGVVVAAVAGVVLWRLADRPEVVVAPPVEAPELVEVSAPKEARWTVQSVPTGAEVFSGDKLLGTAPIEVPTTNGAVVTLKMAGYEDGEARWDPERPVSVVELKPVPAPLPVEKKPPPTTKKPPKGGDILLQR